MYVISLEVANHLNHSNPYEETLFPSPPSYRFTIGVTIFLFVLLETVDQGVLKG